MSSLQDFPDLPNVSGFSEKRLLELLVLFCSVDDFCQDFLPHWKQSLLPRPGDGKGKRNRSRSLCESEIMTILIAFHQSHYRNFKAFYLGFVSLHWRSAFPKLVSYNRFIEYIPSVLVPLFAYLRSLFGQCSGLSFLDSTPLAVCDNHRIHQHKVFAGIAQRGHTSTGWFYGFKLHLVVNDQGEILNLTLTTGEVDDRKPVPDLLKTLFGKVFADKGYISKSLSTALSQQGIELITKIKKKMKPRPISPADRLLLRKRAIIESIIDQLKNISQVEQTRHRASSGFLWNLGAALIAYCHQTKKPSLNFLPNSEIVLA